jgi:hypothetical protein
MLYYSLPRLNLHHRCAIIPLLLMKLTSFHGNVIPTAVFVSVSTAIQGFVKVRPAGGSGQMAFIKKQIIAKIAQNRYRGDGPR